MSASFEQTSQVLVHRLSSISILDSEERAAILALPMQFLQIGRNQDVVRAGDRPSRCCLLLEGFASINKITGDGRRQITAFQLAGDIPDLLSLHLRTLDSNISTITECRLGFIRHDLLHDLCRQFPRITDALWRTTLIDAAIFREWIANIGQRQAIGRIAHILCETFSRSKAVGLAINESCAFPVNQQRIGEATGMSTVHVNRTLQQLRESGLIELRNGTLTIQDWDELQATGDFDPEYLHLHSGQAA